VIGQLRENGAACVHAHCFALATQPEKRYFEFQIVPEASGCIMLECNRLQNYPEK
jgi:hypothetical protein